MNIRLLISGWIWLMGVALMAQGVGMGIVDPHPSAALHIKGINQGLRLPRMTTDKRTVISAAEGLLVFDTTENRIYYHNGSAWVKYEPFPRGAIIIWSGSITNIPDGWVLCDGQRYDQSGNLNASGSLLTPNLMNRFIVGQGTGVFANLDATGGTTEEELNASEVGTHGHTTTTSAHTHTVATSGTTHNHSLSYAFRSAPNLGGYFSSGSNEGIAFQVGPGVNQSTTVDFTVDVSNSTSNLTIDPAGGTSPHENQPVYYVVAFLMKI